MNFQCVPCWAFLSFLLASQGCASDESRSWSQSVGVTTLPLGAVVSAPFELEAAPRLISDATALSRIVCGATDCFAITEQGLQGFGARTLWYRLGPDGSPAEAPRFLDGVSGGTLAAGVRSQEVLIAFSSGGGTAYRHISGVDGSPIGTTTTGLPTSPASITGGGAAWLILFRTGSQLHARVYDSALAPVGPDLDVSAVCRPGELPNVIPGDGQFLLSGNNVALRISATGGQALDATPIALSQYVQFSYANGVYANGTYFLFYGATSAYSIRIKSDGTLLDPDDEFNQKTGAKVLCAASASRMGAALLDGSPAAIWQAGAAVLAAAVDPSTGVRKDGLTTAPPSLFALSATERPFAASSSTHAFVGNGNALRALTAGAGASSIVAGNPVAIARKAEPHECPVVASNGSGYLVAYSTTDEATSKVYATRVDPNTGARLDNPPLLLGNGRCPLVASVGGSYLALFRYASTSSKIQASLVGADGAITGLDPIDTGELSPVSVNARLVGNGASYLLTWADSNTAWGLRLDPQASRLDTGSRILSRTDVIIQDFIHGFGVLADSTPAADRRTFLVLYDINRELVARRLRSESGVIVDPTTTLVPSFSGAWAAATNGSKMLLAYPNATQEVMVAFVDPVTGAFVSNPTASGLKLQPGQGILGAWHDGVSYDVLLGDSTNATWGQKAYLQRFDDTLARLDAPIDGPGSYIGELGEWPTASLGKGRTLLVSFDPDSARLGVGVRGRFIDNDGTAAAPLSLDGGAGAGGAGNGARDGAAGAGQAGAGGSGVAANTGGSGAGRTAAGDAASGGAGAGAGGRAAGGDAVRDGSASATGPAAAVGPTAGGDARAHMGAAGSVGDAMLSGAAGGLPDADAPDGCGCRVTGRPASGPGILGLLFAGVCRLARRRRRNER